MSGPLTLMANFYKESPKTLARLRANLSECFLFAKKCRQCQPLEMNKLQNLADIDGQTTDLNHLTNLTDLTLLSLA